MAAKRESYNIYGKRPVQEYLSGAETTDDIEAVYLSENTSLSLRHELLHHIPKNLLNIIPRKQIDRMFPGVNHQGVVLRMKRGYSSQKHAKHQDWKSLIESGEGMIVLLDRIQDPFNTGNIIRTAEALGAAGVLITGKGASPGPTVDRASAGATIHIPHFQLQNADHVLEFAKNSNYWICSSVSLNDIDLSLISSEQMHLYTTDLENLPPPEQILLIIGNEGEGIKNLILKKTDYFISIPLSGSTSSLNAGTAAGILIDRIINR